MVSSCCAYGCTERANKTSSVTFHRFPKDKEKRKIWETKLRRENFKTTNYSVVCSKHFTPDCFDREKFGGTWLKKTAVPTLFDFPKHLIERKVIRKPLIKKIPEEVNVATPEKDTYFRAKENIAKDNPVMIKLEEEEEEQHHKEGRGKRKRKLPLFLEQYSIKPGDDEEGRDSIQDNSFMEDNVVLDPLIVKMETMEDSNFSESHQQLQLNTTHDKSSNSVHSSLQHDSQLQVAGSSSSTVRRMNFAIVKFVTEDDYVAIISSNWITDDRNSCWYPNSPNVERLLKKRITPTPHWKMYPIEIMKEYGTFSEAREHCTKAENTFNSDFELDQCLKGKTTVPVHFNFEELEECKISSYPSLDSFPNSTPSVSVSSITPSLSSIIPSVSSITSSVPSIFPSISSASSVTLSISSVSSITPSIPYVSSSSHPIESSTASSQLSPASLYPIASGTSEIDSTVAMAIGQLQSTVADLVSEVRNLDRKLDRVLLNNPTGDNTGEREMALVGMLPMSTLEEFDKLENFLKEADFQKLLVKVLITLGGRDCKTFIYNILRRLMTSQLATNFSFTGKPPKIREKDKKKAFCSTLLCRSIQVSVRRMYPETKDDFLKNHISIWLQQAKHRQDRREENKERASSEQNGEFE